MDISDFNHDSNINPHHCDVLNIDGANIKKELFTIEGLKTEDEVQINTDPTFTDTHSWNDIISGIEIDESQMKSENLPFEPKIELLEYVVKEEQEPFVYDVKEGWSNTSEEYSERNSETQSLLCNDIQVIKEETETSMDTTLGSSFFRISDKMEQKRVSLTKKSMKQVMESRNSACQLIKINDRFRCSLCPFQSQLEAQVKEHFKNYHYSKYSHSILDDIVPEKKSDKFETDLIRHSDKRIFHKCEHCDFKSKYKTSLGRHYLKIHSNESKLYKCDYCDYKTKYKYNLDPHLIRHSNEYIFHKCEQCDYKTKRKDCLEKHLIGHSRGIFYKCEHCDYKTKQKSHLRTHLIRHSANCIFYKCDDCDFKTKYKMSLERHYVIVHNESKLYKCDHCNFKTKYNDSLKTHLVRHSQ